MIPPQPRAGGRWIQQGSLWLLDPPRPKAILEFIGGSYLAATPQLSYRRLLEALARLGFRIAAWSYVPGFDHQAQAVDAWRSFRLLRSASPLGAPMDPSLPRLRLGHSLGCKLHLLAPDRGRGCDGLVALSFNNFSAGRSVPLLAEVAPRLGISTEFSPSPEETLALVARDYQQRNNLLVRFQDDQLDQSQRLLGVLQSRPDDASTLVSRRGDHLTPASAGLRQNLLGSWADDPKRQREIEELAAGMDRWLQATD